MNTLKKDIYRLLSILIILVGGNLIFSSCKSLSPVTTSESKYTGNEIFSLIKQEKSDIDTYSARRMLINFVDDDQEMNLRGAIRIKKDSAVMISVNAFAGIEAVRLLFTRDSVKMIDRINKSYFSGNYADSRRFLPYTLNFDILQNIFFASPFSFSDELNMLEGSSENYEFDELHLKLRFSVNPSMSPSGEESYDILQIVLDREFLTSSIDYHSDINNLFASLQFNSYIELLEYNLPDDISLNYVSHNLPLSAGLRLSGIEVNQPVSFPFNIPSGYSQLKN